jgi:hypothetical protein
MRIRYLRGEDRGKLWSVESNRYMSVILRASLHDSRRPHSLEFEEEAIRNIKEAIEAHTLALKDQGLPIPVETFDSLLVVRQHGSHVVLRKSDLFTQLVVPDHKELDTATLRSIIRQSVISVEDFLKLV